MDRAEEMIYLSIPKNDADLKRSYMLYPIINENVFIVSSYENIQSKD